MRTIYNIQGPIRKADGKWHCYVMFAGVCQKQMEHRQKKMCRRLAQQWIVLQAVIDGSGIKQVAGRGSEVRRRKTEG